MRATWVTACLQALKWDEKAADKHNNSIGQHDQVAVPPLSVSPEAPAAEQQGGDPQHPNDAETAPMSSAWPGTAIQRPQGLSWLSGTILISPSQRRLL